MLPGDCDELLAACLAHELISEAEELSRAWKAGELTVSEVLHGLSYVGARTHRPLAHGWRFHDCKVGEMKAPAP